MWTDIRRLTLLQLCNVCNINEARYSKDKSKKRKLVMLGIVWVFLGIMLAFYMGMMAVGYISLGMAEIVPAYVFAITSVVILFFSLFKAGNVIFQLKTYEMLIVLPVSPTAIVVSRFLAMYAGNLLASALTMLPSLLVYACFVGPGVSFYLVSLLGIVLLPLLPMTIATVLGAVVAAISSRMKHKNLVSTVLSMSILIGFMVLSMQSSVVLEQFTEEMMKNLSQLVLSQIERTYPPALFFSDAVVNGNILPFLLFCVGAIAFFVLFVYVVQRNFVKISTALVARAASKNYQMQELKKVSPLKALYQRELKRYFSSSIYVMNTMVGYILMVVAAIALLIVGADKMERLMEIPGLIAKAAPLAFATMCVITSTTSCSISLEGKQWWIAKSLPIRTKEIFDSKILVHLTIALPCYFLSEIFLCMAVDTTPLGYFWLITIPAVYIFFVAVVGITINTMAPSFYWENEVSVVKQSAATMIAMLIGFGSVLVPMFLLLAVPNIPADIWMFGTLVLICLATVVLYMYNNRIDLRVLE